MATALMHLLTSESHARPFRTRPPKQELLSTRAHTSMSSTPRLLEAPPGDSCRIASECGAGGVRMTSSCGISIRTGLSGRLAPVVIERALPHWRYQPRLRYADASSLPSEGARRPCQRPVAGLEGSLHTNDKRFAAPTPQGLRQTLRSEASRGGRVWRCGQVDLCPRAQRANQLPGNLSRPPPLEARGIAAPVEDWRAMQRSVSPARTGLSTRSSLGSGRSSSRPPTHQPATSDLGTLEIGPLP